MCQPITPKIPQPSPTFLPYGRVRQKHRTISTPNHPLTDAPSINLIVLSFVKKCKKNPFFLGEGLLFGRACDSLYHNGNIDYYLKNTQVSILNFIHT
ncbi:hypothetical protein B9R42_19925 [Arthrospira platensis PCC 7345]